LHQCHLLLNQEQSHLGESFLLLKLDASIAFAHTFSSRIEERLERVVGLAVEGDIAEIDVAESILRERLKIRQIK
jgi:hypothetical protein